MTAKKGKKKQPKALRDYWAERQRAQKARDKLTGRKPVKKKK